MKKQLHNWLLWMVTAEVITIMTIVILAAALAGGRAIAYMMIVVAICSWWLALFLQTNADLFDKAIRRTEAKILTAIRNTVRKIKKAGRGATHPASKRQLTIVTFTRP